MWRGSIDFRSGGPYDRFAIRVDRNPFEASSLEYEVIFESMDPGRRGRDGRHDWVIEDGGLRRPTPWLGTPSQALFDWTGAGARERFGVGYGQHHARRRPIYRNTYNGRFATEIGLGTVVRVIDPTAESNEGPRSIDHIGTVIEAAIVTRGSGNTAIRVAVELEVAASQVKVWGPIALGVSIEGAGSWDPDTNTLTVSTDFAGVGGDHDDTVGFTQPPWDTHTAGALRVAIYQSETGVDYPADLEVRADVASVDAEAHTISLTNIVGTLYSHTIKVLVAAPYDEQEEDTWVRALYAPVTEPTGEFDGEKGFRL
jgi:hypothetical protein